MRLMTLPLSTQLGSYDTVGLLGRDYTGFHMRVERPFQGPRLAGLKASRHRHVKNALVAHV
jgi:hypothetical protein